MRPSAAAGSPRATQAARKSSIVGSDGVLSSWSKIRKISSSRPETVSALSLKPPSTRSQSTAATSSSIVSAGKVDRTSVHDGTEKMPGGASRPAAVAIPNTSVRPPGNDEITAAAK